MKNFLYIIAIVFVLVTLNSCTADEIETETPKAKIETEKTKAMPDVQADVDPNNPGSIIPPKG